jgi:hypothetical protein
MDNRKSNYQVKLIADCMLGKLAKWLRIIGCDTLYFHKIDDSQLVELAVKEGRIVLTRDVLLIKRKKLTDRYLFVHSDDFREQFAETVRYFQFDMQDALFSRCVLCNAELLPVDKKAIAGRVPAYVYVTQEDFSRCPVCEKIYWRGTHRENIKRELSYHLQKARLVNNVGWVEARNPTKGQRKCWVSCLNQTYALNYVEDTNCL